MKRNKRYNKEKILQFLINECHYKEDLEMWLMYFNNKLKCYHICLYKGGLIDKEIAVSHNWIAEYFNELENRYI
jgi:murein L,D-transpeptidase YafK